MSMNSLYFTPPLSEIQKHSLYRVFGLDRLNYLFFEILEDTVLQAFRVESGQATVLLEPLEWKNASEENRDPAFPTVILKHRATQLDIRRSVSHKTIGEELFPYPFSELFRNAEGNSGLTVQIQSPLFSKGVTDLKRGLEQLESKIKGCEVTLIWVKSVEGSFPLLFHYVRGRRIRVGSSERLWELGTRFDAGELTAEEMRPIFGTQVAAFRICMGSDVASDPLETLNQGLDAALVSLSEVSSNGNIIPSVFGTDSRDEALAKSGASAPIHTSGL
jgi:hypothetical protein